MSSPRYGSINHTVLYTDSENIHPDEYTVDQTTETHQETTYPATFSTGEYGDITYTPRYGGGSTNNAQDDDVPEILNSLEDSLPSWRSWTKKQICANLLIYFGTTSVAMCTSMIGPSLLDLQLILGTSISHVNWLLSARALGTLLGTLLVGKTLKNKSRWLQLCGALLVGTIAFTLIPWSPYITVDLLLFALYGVSQSYKYCGSLLITFMIWEERTDSLTWINGQQLVNNLGSLAAPIIIDQFLALKPNVTQQAEWLDTTFMFDQPFRPSKEIYGPSSSTSPSLLISRPSNETQVMYGYLIGGSISLLSTAALFIGYFAMGGILNHDYVENDTGNSHSRSSLNCYRFALICLLFINSFSFGNVVRNYPSFIMTYTVHALDWTKSEGAYLISSMFITAAISKGVCIFAVRLIMIEVQLLLGSALVLLSTLLLYFMSTFDVLIPWAATIILVLGYTNVNAVTFGWIDKCLGLQGIVGVTWNIGGCLGGMTAPFIVGFLFQDVSYDSFLIFLLCGSSFCCFTWILLISLAKCYKNAQDYRPVDFERDPLLIET